MKVKKIFLAVLIFAMAIGVAFATQADKVTKVIKAAPESEGLLQLGHYKVNNNICEPFEQVPCNPLPITPYCEWIVPDIGLTQMYDKDCQPLHYDQLQ